MKMRTQYWIGTICLILMAWIIFFTLMWAIATIRDLADTLEDRAVVVRLQRKPPGATVERLGRRDNADFAALRSQAARWAADNFDKLADSDPKMPDLNDRAADNWRPLLAIADLADGEWPQEARRAAYLLSGQEQDGAIGVELLRDIRSAFGDADVIRSSDLVAKLTADPERPWAEWKHGRPLTQKQLAALLAPFHIISLTVHPPGLPDGKGYRRIDFKGAWAAYCPGRNTPSQQSLFKRPNAAETCTTRDFRTVREFFRINRRRQLVLQPWGLGRLDGSKTRKWGSDMRSPRRAPPHRLGRDSRDAGRA